MSTGKFHILFVCSGNSCRSPMAEGMLRALLPAEFKEKVVVKSAGTLGLDGNRATEFAIQTAHEFGADISEHRSQGLTRELAEEADIIFVMAAGHKEYMDKYHPEVRENVFLLKLFDRDTKGAVYEDIDDPIGRGLNIYRQCGKEIHDELQRVLPRLTELIKAKFPETQESS